MLRAILLIFLIALVQIPALADAGVYDLSMPNLLCDGGESLAQY